MLAEVHADYLRAGADALTANTFRTHRRSLGKAGLGDRAAELTKLAVEIARRACDEHRPDGLVLGSVSPLEDCYQPALAPDESSCRREHAEMIGHLVESGADGILIETMNNLTEARAAIEAARTLAPDRWIVCFCTKSQGPPGNLLSGEPLAPFVTGLEGAVAVGVNCVSATTSDAQVEFLRRTVADHVRIAVYANIGYADDPGNWVVTDAVEPAQYALYAQRWLDAGATIIGGCCGTTPETIRAVRKRLED